MGDEGLIEETTLTGSLFFDGVPYLLGVLDFLYIPGPPHFAL